MMELENVSLINVLLKLSDLVKTVPNVLLVQMDVSSAQMLTLVVSVILKLPAITMENV